MKEDNRDRWGLHSRVTARRQKGKTWTLVLILLALVSSLPVFFTQRVTLLSYVSPVVFPNLGVQLFLAVAEQSLEPFWIPLLLLHLVLLVLPLAGWLLGERFPKAGELLIRLPQIIHLFATAALLLFGVYTTAALYLIDTFPFYYFTLPAALLIPGLTLFFLSRWNLKQGGVEAG